MGVVRVIALLVLPIAFFSFGLAAGLFVDELQQSREEFTLGDDPATGLLPADRISKDDVRVYADHVEIRLPGAQWASFAPTGSMLPVLGTTAHALQINPLNESDIHRGDIVSFRYDGKFISHRVIDIREDEQGTYYVTKGDNNPDADPVLVRFEHIDRVVVAILY